MNQTLLSSPTLLQRPSPTLTLISHPTAPEISSFVPTPTPGPVPDFPLPSIPTPVTQTTPHRPRAIKLIQTKHLSRADWLRVRLGGIGSSDAAAAVGLNPYQSQLALWLEKTGRDTNTDNTNTSTSSPPPNHDPLSWGNLLEPLVAAQYSQRTGYKVRRVNAVLQHPQYPWMRANIDRAVVAGAPVQLLECKTAGVQGARLWQDGVPEYVQLQVMHQLSVTGYQAADVAVLLGGHELQIFRVQRDEALIEQLIALEQQFWDGVQRDQAPAADGTDSAAQALRRLYPQDDNSTLDLSNEPAMLETFTQLCQVRQHLASHHALEAQLKQRLEQRMGVASRAQFGAAGAVSWKRSKDSSTLDSVRLLQEQPELLARYPLLKPGVRRFLLQSQL